MCVYLLDVLVHLHRAVEALQLFHEELQVGVDEAELQQHTLTHLIVAARPVCERESDSERECVCVCV